MGEFESKYKNLVANKLFYQADKKIKGLIIQLDDEQELNEYYEAIFRILFKRKEPALIMKYLSYVEPYHKKISLINLLSDGEKDKYFDLCDASEYELIISSFESDELKLKYLIKFVDEVEMFHVGLTIKLDDNKIKCLDFFMDEFYKMRIVASFRDKHKILTVFSMFSTYYQKQLIENVLSDELMKEAFSQVSYYVQFYIMENIGDDQFKVDNLEKFQLRDQITIMATFNDEKLLLSIINDKKYLPYVMELLDVITDVTFLEYLFDSCKEIRKKIQIIDKITNIDLKRKLIGKIGDEFYRVALESNLLDRKTAFTDKQDISGIKQDIDKNITFGVELEACIDDAGDVLTLKRVLSNWEIQCDLSVKQGVEIISPVLRFTDNDLKELKFMCEFMENNGFYIDQNCGGHLHFGFDYFKTIDEFNIFLNLYGNVEDVLYLISNRNGSVVRKGIERYADKFRTKLDEIANLDINWELCHDLAKYAGIIKGMIDSRYYGLNLLNMNEVTKNTVEFRMPNGEFNFDEVILNIRLFAKMMECSKQINEILNGKSQAKCNLKKIELYQKLISVELSEREKVSYLLNILFDDLEERKQYYKRYINNGQLNSQFKKNECKVLYLSRYNN